MSMKLLVHDSRYTPAGDPEGLTHADLINEHLPPHVRVLAVQKTNNKFNARHQAATRTYEYYLPSSLLGERGRYRALSGHHSLTYLSPAELKLDGSDFDKERIDVFRKTLRCGCLDAPGSSVSFKNSSLQCDFQALRRMASIPQLYENEVSASLIACMHFDAEMGAGILYRQCTALPSYQRS